MRLLVTRPEPDAARTAERLVGLGHEPIVQPLLTIAFNAPPDDLRRPGAILVTSQNAVRALTQWRQISDWLGVPVFAAGPATARALAAAGFTDVRMGAGDSGSLADTVLRDYRKDAGPLLYPAARNRAGALAGGLTAQGYDVRTVEAYRADPVARFDPKVRDALSRRAVDGILLFSGRTAKTLRAAAAADGITAALGQPRYYVISDHVAGIVREFGADVRVARSPDEDSLLALISAAA
jgi:uroporphyrinogen-III synthase